MSPPTVIRDGTYRIRSGQPNNHPSYLELQSNDTISVVPLNTSSMAQTWKIVSVPDGAYKIICADRNIVLGITSSATVAGVGTGSQHTWTIEPRGDSFVIGNTINGLVIHLAEARHVLARDRNNSFNQRWVLDPIALDGTPGIGSSTTWPVPTYTYSSVLNLSDGFSAVAASSGWHYCLAIDVPNERAGLQLASLDFVIKYANSSMTTHSTFQVDVILTSVALPTGITPESTALGVYRSGGNYRPYIINRDVAEHLHKQYGIKRNDTGPSWTHQVIADSLAVMRPIVPPWNRLYILFHTFEYVTAQTSRCLTMDATASWLHQ